METSLLHAFFEATCRRAGGEARRLVLRRVNPPQTEWSVRSRTLVGYTPNEVQSHHFYGAICLTQAVAEGISKFLTLRNGHRDTGNRNSRIALLKKRGVISLEAYRAFKRIEGGDRNDYHHLNANIETDLESLELRAGECVLSLFAIQIEVFAFSVGEAGTMVVVNPQYWPRVDEKFISTHIDFT